MKHNNKLYSIAGIVILLLLGMFAFKQQQPHTNQAATALAKKETQKIRGFRKAIEYQYRLRANQTTGELNLKDIYKAREMVRVKEETKEGLEMNWEFMGPNNVGGRTRALLVDPDNTNKLLMGSVAGGLWQSNDGGMNWTEHPQNHELENLAVSCMTYDKNGYIYVGTGEGFARGLSGDAGGGIMGSGIYKSTDNGATFSLMPSSIPSSNNTGDAWATVHALAAHPTQNIVYAGTQSGFYMSYDGGDWEKVTNISGAGQDVAVASNGTVHVVSSSKYYRATDGENFEELSGQNLGQIPVVGGRKRIKVAPSDPNYVYISSANGFAGLSFCLRWVMQSTDGGTTWIEIGTGGSNAFKPFGYPSSSICQGDYDQALAVDPINPNRIFLAGISFWEWEGNTGGWTQKDNVFAAVGNPYQLHADKHDILFDPENPNLMYIVSDGGIARSTNAQSASLSFQTINKNYNVTQFYSVAAGLDGIVMAGSQDNGTQLVSFDSNSVLDGDEVYGGDGGYTEISDINPNVMFGSYVDGTLRRSGSGGDSFSNFFDQHIDCIPRNMDGSCNPDGAVDGNPEFITPFVLWEDLETFLNTGEEKARFATGSGNGKVWMLDNPLQTNELGPWFNVGNFSGSQTISCVAFSKDGNTLFAGSSTGSILRITNLNTVNLEDLHDTNYDSNSTPSNVTQINLPSNLGGGQYVTSLYVSNFGNTLHISLGNYGNSDYVVVSNNVQADAEDVEFESIQADLPPMPVYDVVVDKGDPNIVLAGTDMGVWSGHRTQIGVNEYEYTWQPQNTGLGPVPVFRLRQENIQQPPIVISPDLSIDPTIDCFITYIGTHGKGIFRSTSLTLGNCEIPDPISIYNGINDELAPTLKLKAYPNPVAINSTLNIELSLKISAHTEVAIYDLQGREVKRQTLGQQQAGTQQLSINTSQLSAGTYLVVAHTDDYNVSQKIVVQ